MKDLFRKLHRSSRAATAIEYALIASLIGISALGGYESLGGGVTSLWGNMVQKVADAT